MSVGLGTQPALMSGDLALDVDAKVGGTRQALGLARQAVLVPQLLLHADHAAGSPLRRHADSVADYAMDGHPGLPKESTGARAPEGHHGVLSNCSRGANRPALKPP